MLVSLWGAMCYLMFLSLALDTATDRTKTRNTIQQHRKQARPTPLGAGMEKGTVDDNEWMVVRSVENVSRIFT